MVNTRRNSRFPENFRASPASARYSSPKLAARQNGASRWIASNSRGSFTGATPVGAREDAWPSNDFARLERSGLSGDESAPRFDCHATVKGRTQPIHTPANLTGSATRSIAQLDPATIPASSGASVTAVEAAKFGHRRQNTESAALAPALKLRPGWQRQERTNRISVRGRDLLARRAKDRRYKMKSIAETSAMRT